MKTSMLFGVVPALFAALGAPAFILSSRSVSPRADSASPIAVVQAEGPVTTETGESAKAVQRRVAFMIRIEGTDDETFADEDTRRSFNRVVMLSTDHPTAPISVPDVRWGGECRVEIEMEATLLADGRVSVHASGDLYEGDSDDSNDLEDEESINFAVPKGGKPVKHDIKLRNRGWGGGDHAEIAITVTNSLDEE